MICDKLTSSNKHPPPLAKPLLRLGFLFGSRGLQNFQNPPLEKPLLRLGLLFGSRGLQNFQNPPPLEKPLLRLGLLFGSRGLQNFQKKNINVNHYIIQGKFKSLKTENRKSFGIFSHAFLSVLEMCYNS